jgi:hypothetical protein
VVAYEWGEKRMRSDFLMERGALRMIRKFWNWRGGIELYPLKWLIISQA